MSASMPCVLAPVFMPQGGAGGQNLGHLKKCFFYFFVMEITYADSWSDSLVTLTCSHEVKVSMTYISQLSDFVLYLEDYLMYEHHSLGY